MNKVAISLLGLLVVLAIAVGGLITQASQVPSFQPSNENPVFENGPAGSWDAFRVDPGAVLYHNGQFHMFYNAFRNWPGEVNIGYATSADGINWERQSDEPVFRTSDVPFADVAITATSAVVDDSGNWVLYFHTWNTFSANLGSGVIGRAVANSPTGPWNVDATPVLEIGESGNWDDGQVSQASVVRDGDEWRMYYTGADSRGFMRVGLATSNDGIDWTRRAEPVMEPDASSWDRRGTYQNRVVPTDSGWLMAYHSFGAQLVNNGLGLAYSEDGITWNKEEANPVLLPDPSLNQFALQGPALVQHEGTYFLYYEGQRPNPNSEIYLAIGE